MGPIFNNCPYYWVTGGRDIVSCSLYCGIFKFWIIVEKKLFKTLAVSLSFFKILLPSASAVFSLDIILLWLQQQWFNYFQNVLLSHTRHFIQTVLLMSVYEQRLSFPMFYFITNNYKTCEIQVGIWCCCKFRSRFMAEPSWRFRG